MSFRPCCCGRATGRTRTIKLRWSKRQREGWEGKFEQTFAVFRLGEKVSEFHCAEDRNRDNSDAKNFVDTHGMNITPNYSNFIHFY